MCRATAANRQNFPYFVVFSPFLAHWLMSPWHAFFFPNNRHECWILRSADVWTVHNSSLETFNNPYAPLGVTWDETCWVLCSLERTRKQNNTVSLKCSNHLFTCLFAFFFFFAHCHPPWFRLVCLPTPASSKHRQRFNGRGERENERQWESERGSRSRDALWVTPLNEARCTVHGAPSAERTSKPVLHLYCQHLG